MTRNTYLIAKFYSPCFALASFKNIQRLSSCLLIWGICLFGLYAQSGTQEGERIIVKFKEGTSFLSRMASLDRYKSQLYKKHLTSGYHILVPNDYSQTSIDQILDELQRDESVEWAEKDLIYKSLTLPNDTEFNKQWGLASGEANINAEEAWKITQGSPETVVAVIDGGIDWTHPDLVANIWQNSGEDLDGDGVIVYLNGRWQFDPDDMNGIDDDNNGYPDDFIGWDFINNDNNPYDDTYFGHGTHVAGIIGAQGNNGQGIAGVSWSSKLMPLKFLDDKSRGYVSDAVEALDYAVQMGVKISNNSWGGYGFTQALSDAVKRAESAGHLLIAAAGNDSQNNDANPLYPASIDRENIIAVTASDENDNLANFANFGINSVDIAAPGLNIFSTLPEAKYGYSSGTSMAAPFVSGAACLLLTQNPSIGMVSLKDKLLSNIDQPEGLIAKSSSSGRLNIAKALQEEDNSENCRIKTRFYMSRNVICTDSDLFLLDLSSSANSRRWVINGQTVSNSRYTKYRFQEDGVYAISLVASSGDCSRTLTKYVTVISLPKINIENVTVCRSSVILDANCIGSNYVWHFRESGDDDDDDDDDNDDDDDDNDDDDNDGVSGIVIGRNSTVIATKSGNYTLTVTDGCGKTKSKTIRVVLSGDCVWPGDVNTDGVVNHLDILSWGMAYGATGAARSNVSSDYSAQQAPDDWNGFFPENYLGQVVNYKHADCNGDGVVNMEDADVIRQNAENTCTTQLDLAEAANISLGISTDQESLSWGDRLNYNVSLNVGDNGELDDVYGVAFTLEYSLPFAQAGVFELPTSWLGHANEDVASFSFDQEGGTCTRTAFVRTNQESISTTGGVIGQRGVIIAIDDIDTYSILNQEVELAIKISEAILFKGDGSMLTIRDFSAQNTKRIKILPQKTKESILTNIYPNPTNGTFSLEIITSESSQNKVFVTNLLGETVYAHNLNLTKGKNVFKISLPNLSKGVYLLQIKDEENYESASKKLIIR